MKLFGWKSAGRLLSRPAQKSFVPPEGATLINGEGLVREAWQQPYEAQLRTLYLTNPIAQRAVRMVAEGVASIPFKCRDDAAKKLILATSAGQSLLESLAAQLLLHGNGYVQMASDASGQLAELFALRPERIRIEPDARGWPAAFRYTVGRTITRLAPDEVIHIRTHHPLDDHYGLGCLGAAAGAIALHNASARWNKALLDNAARPSGALVTDGETLSADQFGRLKDELDALYRGASNAGRPMLLEGGLKWQAISLSPADMDFAGLKAAAARDIALAFGVPPMLLGLPGDSTHANYREANKALWRLTVLPLARKLLATLEQGLSAHFADLRLEIDHNQIAALADERQALWRQVAGADFLSTDEKRAEIGYLPVKDAEMAALPTHPDAPAPEDVAALAADGADSASDDAEGEAHLADARPNLETKFNPNHDPKDGRFTSEPGGGVEKIEPAGKVANNSKPPRSRYNITIPLDAPELMPKKLSKEGLDFLKDAEGSKDHTYFPGGASGVTIGVGYDMRGKTKTQIKADLLASGVDQKTATALSSAAGLHGKAARTFATKNAKVIKLNNNQILALLDITSKRHVDAVRRVIKVPLTQGQFDALVSLHYNRETAVSGEMATLLNKRDYAGAANQFDKFIKVSRIVKGRRKYDVSNGLKDRRAGEKRMFLGR